jgi:hypothetical protein
VAMMTQLEVVVEEREGRGVELGKISKDRKA